MEEPLVSGLAKDGVRVGLNWSGARAIGYDLEPRDVELALAARLPCPEGTDWGIGECSS